MRRFALPLAVAAVLVSTYAAAVAAHPAARGDFTEDQFVVGTIQYPGGQHGTSFAFHVPASKPDILTYGLAVRFILHGPKGWNHGHALNTKCVQIPRESLDTCDSWANIPPVAGDYTAIGASGSTWTAAINLTPVTPPQALTARATSAGISVSWRRGTDTGAYYLEVDDLHSHVLGDTVLPGGVRKHLFSGVQVKPGAHYWVYIDAYPTNITKDIKLSTTWSVSGASYYLTAP